MNPVSFCLVLTGVLLNAGAQLLLKAGVNRIGHFSYSFANLLPIGWKIALEPHILGGLGLYVISVGVWIMALSRVPVSIAYPMLSIGYVVNAVAAWYWLGESVTVIRIIGMAVIIFGVYLVASS
ncbi:MAG TPA: SMR family transporter [Burkholderiales bacterium]|nr:EamA family transporter [Pseudomonadota bacterium]HVC49516.1 SMR family transporter [Burkholderiales bacterium]